MKKTFEDLAAASPRAAECLAIALFRRVGVLGPRVSTITEAELLEADAFQLVCETSVDGKSLTVTLERKVPVL